MESYTDINSKGDGIDGRSIEESQCTGFQISFGRKRTSPYCSCRKKSANEREYTVIIPKTDTMGSRFGKCTSGYPSKEGIPCDHMVAISKLGRINGLTWTAVMPHWYTTAQWRNQFPENTYIDTHKTLRSIKANSTPHDNLRYCSNWVGPKKKGRPKKETRRKSIANHIKQSAKKKRRTTKPTKTSQEERVDLEGKDIKDGQEGKM
jgi:hypothetical protein